MQITACGIFIAFGEIVGLNDTKVFEWRRIFVDHHKVDHLKGREVESTEVLRNVRAIQPFIDVTVRGQTGDKNLGFALCIKQMANMTGVNNVEYAMTHNDLVGSRRRSENLAQFFGRFYFVLVLFRKSERHANLLISPPPVYR